jgi:hypothetical protein
MMLFTIDDFAQKIYKKAHMRSLHYSFLELQGTLYVE